MTSRNAFEERPSVDVSHALAWVAATASIEDRIHGLCIALTSEDRAAALAAFAPDAICCHGEFQGSAADFVDAELAGRSALAMREAHLTGHLSDVDGDHAGAESYVIMPVVTSGGEPGMCGGRLLHRLCLTAGDWLITRHEFVIDWAFAWPKDDQQAQANLETTS